MVHIGLFMKKTRGRKSRATVPLRICRQGRIKLLQQAPSCVLHVNDSATHNRTKLAFLIEGHQIPWMFFFIDVETSVFCTFPAGMSTSCVSTHARPRCSCICMHTHVMYRTFYVRIISDMPIAAIVLKVVFIYNVKSRQLL